MNFFRRLAAEIPGELLAAQVAATRRHAESADPAGPMPSSVPSVDDKTIFAALCVLEDNPGVLTHNTPGLPVPANADITNLEDQP